MKSNYRCCIWSGLIMRLRKTEPVDVLAVLTGSMMVIISVQSNAVLQCLAA